MKRKIAEIINVIFGFRKFFLMLFVMGLAVVFRCKDLINGAEMVDLVKQVSIAFMGANGVEHIVGAVTTYMNAKNAGPTTDGPADTNEANDEQDSAEAEPKD